MSLLLLRLELYRDVVLADQIVLKDVQSNAFNGIPEEPGLRARYWKVKTIFFFKKKKITAPFCEQSFVTLITVAVELFAVESKRRRCHS